jgi:glycine dehydrogenase
MRGRENFFEEEISGGSDFLQRHLGVKDSECVKMLGFLGEDWESFMGKVIPDSIREEGELPLTRCCNEGEAERLLMGIADRNKPGISMIGKGFYKTDTPAVLRRNILESPGWYTAYTPYQAEISQGRLEALMVFQTMVTELTGMEIANASLLDESSAAAEAMLLCSRKDRGKRKRFFVDSRLHPQTIEVLRTRALPLGIDLVESCVEEMRGDEEDVLGVMVQYPDTDGDVMSSPDFLKELCENLGAMLCVVTDPMSLVLLRPPGDWGADVVVGSMQRFGLPMMYGGPHAGYMATKKEYTRLLPGRLIGLSVDNAGKPAYRMALQTREQHIRRDQATSNICTAQALPAIMGAMFGVYHGSEGLLRIANRIHDLASTFVGGLRQAGLGIRNKYFFDTVSVATGSETDKILSRAYDRGYYFWREDDETITLSFDEHSSVEDIKVLYEIFLGGGHGLMSVTVEKYGGLPSCCRREDICLSHRVFHRYRSETAMMRYLRELKNKDLALDQTMIPLGSCTMKLNASSEMEPVTWPHFSNMHPFSPREASEGFEVMLRELEQMLCVVTGYDGCSLQPNAGSQGEVAGLLAIRGYHYGRGEGHRHVCLVPESAHGTNPASVVLVGWKVVGVKHDEDGSISLSDLEEKLLEYGDDLAAMMITYPSTYGVFDENVRVVCERVHDHGGQVYIDGANMNAMVGVCRVGKFGGDVSHLNLHKTFCIPHGGGGPGVGAIGVKEHLRAYMPGHFWGERNGFMKREGALTSAPYGSAGVMPISWMYMVMMGSRGLRLATERALLAANYIAKRLQPHYKLLFSNVDGYVAHECVIDLREFKGTAGCDVDDVAKRLMDYGFHAPTVSFPVVGTMMIEPTESEPLEELDRFIDAMLSIREEIGKVERGEWSREDNPLKNAPHSARSVAKDEWTHPYSREEAAWPTGEVKGYWPPVGRIDNLYGDRHVVATIPRDED